MYLLPTLLFSCVILRCFSLPHQTFMQGLRDQYKITDLPVAEPGIDLGYSGHINIRGDKGRMFFWYFDAKNKKEDKETPLVIWLQGGPGASSLIGLFNMNGPIKLTSDKKIINNKYSWNKEYSLLFIDQPVGTGYSIVNNKTDNLKGNECYNHEGYVKAQCGIAKDLIEFLKEFTKIFPETLKRPIYITGESYAGKYIPIFANAIVKHNKKNEDKYDLKGIAIGNGLTDPISQIKAYGNLALGLGLVTPKQSRHINDLSSQAVILANEKRWDEATDKRDEIFEYYKKVSYDVDFYDVRMANQHVSWKNMEDFLNLNQTKQSLHVPDYTKFSKNPYVKEVLKADGMKSVIHLFKNLKGLKMLFYQGQFDYRDGSMSQYEWLYPLFPCLERTERKSWMFGQQLAGYNTTCDTKPTLSHFIVLQAGHRVGYDQPERSLDLITKFINN